MVCELIQRHEVERVLKVGDVLAVDGNSRKPWPGDVHDPQVLCKRRLFSEVGQLQLLPFGPDFDVLFVKYKFWYLITGLKAKKENTRARVAV